MDYLSHGLGIPIINIATTRTTFSDDFGSRVIPRWLRMQQILGIFWALTYREELNVSIITQNTTSEDIRSRNPTNVSMR